MVFMMLLGESKGPTLGRAPGHYRNGCVKTSKLAPTQIPKRNQASST
jgi:hypothetical protein